MEGQLSDSPVVRLPRTLVIGLGSTGQEVVTRIRRLLTSRYGKLSNVPFIRFLVLDGASRDAFATDDGPDIRLSNAEILDTALVDPSHLVAAIKAGDLPHFSWLSTDSFEIQAPIGDASLNSSRQHARLGLWHNVAHLKLQLARIFDDLCLQRVRDFAMESHNAELETGLSCHIIAGLGEARSSGLLLDVAYFLRNQLQGTGLVGPHSLIGHLVMPEVHAAEFGDIALASGYAVLKELNWLYYNANPNGEQAFLFGQPAWEADYFNIPGQTLRAGSSPPFDYCYLVEAMEVEGDQVAPFAPLARAIYFEATPNAIGPSRRRQRGVGFGGLTDRLDCPNAFRSFGLTSIELPRAELQELLVCQTAIRAVHHWLALDDRAFDVHAHFRQGGQVSGKVQGIKTLIESQAGGLVKAVAHGLSNELLPELGLQPGSLLDAILSDGTERVADIPYRLVEAMKVQASTEDWEIPDFEAKVPELWARWQADFHSPDGEGQANWGTTANLLLKNAEAALESYSERIRTKALDLFVDNRKYGPAFALCAVRGIRAHLEQARVTLLQEASDPLALARLLGNIEIIRRAQALSSATDLPDLINQRVNKEISKFRDIATAFMLFGKRDKVRVQAEVFLGWAAHCLSAHVELRARLVAADCAERLRAALSEVENELLGRCQILEDLRSMLLEEAHSCLTRALGREVTGHLLFGLSEADGRLWQVFESRVLRHRTEICSAEALGLSSLGAIEADLRALRREDLPTLRDALLGQTRSAIGDLGEFGDFQTEFAVYDLASALHPDDGDLARFLEGVIARTTPLVGINDAPPGMSFIENQDWRRDFLCYVRGGEIALEDDEDGERARFRQELRRAAPGATVYGHADSSEVVLLLETSGLPLRAIKGIDKLRAAYEAHRETVPLHFARNDLMEHLPDPIPRPDLLERVRRLVVVAIPAGAVMCRDVPAVSGGKAGQAQHLFVPTGSAPVRLGRSVQAMANTLLASPELVGAIETDVHARMGKADQRTKGLILEQLDAHLETLKSVWAHGSPSPMHERLEDIADDFAREYGLALEAVVP